MIDRLSAALGRIAPSATLAMSGRVIDLKAQGIDVIGLSAGEPDFDTPAHIRRAACEAIERGETRYTMSAGTPALRQAICDKLLRENGLSYQPRDIILQINNVPVATVQAAAAQIDAAKKAKRPTVLLFAQRGNNRGRLALGESGIQRGGGQGISAHVSLPFVASSVGRKRHAVGQKQDLAHARPLAMNGPIRLASASGSFCHSAILAL